MRGGSSSSDSLPSELSSDDAGAAFALLAGFDLLTGFAALLAGLVCFLAGGGGGSSSSSSSSVDASEVESFTTGGVAALVLRVGFLVVFGAATAVSTFGSFGALGLRTFLL